MSGFEPQRGSIDVTWVPTFGGKIRIRCNGRWPSFPDGKSGRVAALKSDCLIVMYERH